MTYLHCPICGQATPHPLQATWQHLRMFNSPKIWWGYFVGTWKSFGFVAAITLVSPVINTIIHWKYRRSRLEIKESQ